MLQIDKNSLHYRFTYKGWFTPTERCVANNLCEYIRQFVGSAILATIASFSVASMIVCLLYGGFVLGFNFESVGPLMTLFMGFGMVGWFLVGMFAVLMGCIALGVWIEELSKERQRRMRAQGIKPTPNIFMEYLRALKDKVCPMVEFVDDGS